MFKFDLQMFADGGDASGMADTGSLAMSDGGDVDTGASVETSNESSPDSNTESFDSLIKGRYKSEYDAKVKATMDKRFRNQADYQKKYEGIMPMLEMVAERYGFDTSDMSKLDIDGLTKKVTEDRSYYEQEAFEKGIDVNVLMQQKQLERENRRLNQVLSRQADEEAQRQFNANLHARADEVRGMYPDFDLDAEMQNETFFRILANLDAAGDKNAMRTAYEVVHKDEILATGMQFAAQKTAEKVANSIRSGNRPSEHSMSTGGTAALSDTDPRKFTRADFERLKSEAERGKKIYLN